MITNEEDREQIIRYTLAKLQEAPVLARNKLEVLGRPFRYRTAYFRIKKYVDEFLGGEPAGLTNRLVILPGLRGVGKTTIVFQIYDYLVNKRGIEQDRVLYFSADELKAYMGRSVLEVIDSYVQDVHKASLVNLDRELFIFVDEAHFDKTWSESAKIVFDKSNKVFMIFTGSSALNLELTVDAARRTTKEVVFPMNFSEYIILKHDIFPPENMAESIRNVIFRGDEDHYIEVASGKEAELSKKLLSLKRSLSMEWEEYVCCRGFPFTLNMDSGETHEKIFSMVERVIEKDMTSIQSFNTSTRNTISRLITFLALQFPGGTSDAKLSERLQTSPTLVRSVLDVLEKTYLIFSVKPYGSAGRVVRKAWKYYFLSPSINSAIRFKLGAYDTRSREMFGLLTENAIGSYFVRMKETTGLPRGVFYDPESRGVDFLIHDAEENVIPVEVGYGNKDKGQVEGAMKRYKSKYGIIICDCPAIRKEGNIIYMPFTTFSFV